MLGGGVDADGLGGEISFIQPLDATVRYRRRRGNGGGSEKKQRVRGFEKI